MSKFTLVLIHRGPDYERDFKEIADRVQALDPQISVYVCNKTTVRAIPKEAWQWPALVVSLVHGPLPVPRGTAIQSQLIDKLVQLRTVSAAGVSVPPALPFKFGMWLDPVMFRDFVVIKPRDPKLTSTNVGIHLFRRRRLEAITPHYFSNDHPIYRDRVGYMVQRYIDQGLCPTYNRVLTFLGRPIYEASGRRLELGPDLSASDNDIERADITMHGGTRERRWGVDDDVRVMATQVAAAFPSVPLLAIDILREEKTGQLFFLECNPGGNTWHFSSRQPGGLNIRMILGEAERYGKAKALELGRQRMIEQTGAFNIVAAALVEVTRACAS